MKRAALFRVIFCLLLVGVITAGSMTLLAKPGSGKGFLKCPWPPCMIACEFPPQPEVLCKSGGKTFETSFACCCCGGGSGARYRPLN